MILLAAIAFAFIFGWFVGQGLTNVGNGIATGLEEIAKAIKANKKS